MKRMKWKRLMRQGLAVSLALAMCISTGPITAFAEADEVAEKTSTVNEDSKPENQKTDETESVGIKDGKAEADETKSGETKSDETASDETKTDEETSDDSESSDGPAGAPENNTEDKQNGGAETKEHTHDWDDGAVTEEATCSKAGVKTYTCKAEDCKETKTEELPVTEHLDEDNNDICDVCEECLAETDSETVRTFLAAVEALKKWEAKENADEEELEKMLADFRASYESAKALYDGLTDGQKMLEEITAAYGDLTDIGAGLELMTLEAADSVSGDMTGSSFLEKAVDGVITLDGDVTITDNVVWVQNTLALDLNGHTIYGRVACYKGNLTIRDSAGTGRVITKGNQGSTLLNNGEDGTTSLTVEGGTFIAPQGCNSLYNMNGAAADIKGGTFENGVGNGWWDGDKANEGGGVINITGGVLKTQEFSDGTFTVCIPAITNAAEVNISGGATIQSENSACVIENYGTMNINGGLVKAKEKNFGVIGNYNDGTINIRGGEFVGAIDNWFIAEETKPVKIYGGTFSFPVEYTDKMTSYLIDGLMFDTGGKVVEDQNTRYVARIDAQGYDSLQEAVNAAENGDTVTLLKETNEDVTVSGTVILDLNGKILRGAGSADAAIINNGTLTITDNADAADENGMGTIVGINHNSKPKSAIINNAGASCTIAGGRITRAPYLDKDNTDQDNVNTNSNYTIQNKGTMYITGGLIVNNSHKSSMVVNLNNQGGGIYGQSENVKMEISGGTLRQNTYTALKNDPNSTMKITGNASIANGTATSYVTQFYGNVTIDGGSFSGGQLWICSHADAKGHYPTNVNITGGSIDVSEIRAIYGYTQSALDKTEKVTVKISGNADVSCPKLSELKYDQSSGNYNIVSDNAMSEIAVSGGTFSTQVSPDHCAKGFVPTTTADENGKYTVIVGEADAVASITTGGNTTYYLTLQDAVNAAKDGDTVTLLKDVNAGNSWILISKAITLDLNKNTVTGAGDYTLACINAATVKNGTVINTKEGSPNMTASVYAQNTAITLENVTVNGTNTGIACGPGKDGYYGCVTVKGNCDIYGGVTGVAVYGANKANATVSELKLENGKISGGRYGIAGNGSYDGTNIKLQGGTVEGAVTAVYHPQQGTLTVPAESTVSVSGLVGLQMCGGSANIAGGNFVSTDKTPHENPFKPGEQNDGTAQDGAALSILSREAYGNVVVNVTGGTFTAQTGNLAVRMYGFAKVNDLWTASEEHPYATASISGGTFSTPVPAEYCAEGFEPVSNGDNTYSVKSSKPDDTGNTGGTTGGNTSGDNTPGSGTTGGSNTGSTTGGSSSSSGGGSSSGSGSSSSDNTDDTSAPAAAPAPAVTVVTAPAATPAPAAAAPAAEDTPAAEENVAVDDEEVPLADGDEVKETEDEEEPETESESVILEDEETPLAAKPGRNWTLLSIIPAALAAAFIILILLRRKKEEEEEA